MMRFVLGLFIVMGAVGGLEQNTMTINQCLAFSMMGFLLMCWALPDIWEEYGE